MHSMVKLHDLVDLIEPPWRNLVEASTYRQLRDEVMEWDAEVAERDKEVAEPLATPGETNMGLG